MRILVVEDEAVLREGLVDLLETAGHRVDSAEDGEKGLALGSEPGIEMVLLDLMLPRLSGIEVCRRLRELRPGLPILILTARGAEDDKVSGLGAGADDYVTKPFGTRELLARIEAMARRLNVGAEQPLLVEADGCRLDLGRCEAQRDGDPVSLTAREAQILRWLFQHRTRAVGRAELLENIWGQRGDLQTRTVDMTVANLRHKIERDASRPRIVVTVKGVGYAWGGS